MEQKELDKIIKLHEKWVVGNSNGKCADLSNIDLGGADLSDATLNWVNWHEARGGVDVYVAGLRSSRHNAQLAYIPSLDITTTGCWQNTWEATKKRVKDVYKESDSKIYRKYKLAFQYIEAQMVEDKGEVIKNESCN